MTPEAWLVAYQAQAGLIFAITASHPDESVPSCPGWTLRDLAAHVGGAAALWGPVLEAPPGAPPGEILRPEVPEALDELLAWCAVELQSMVELFRATDPDAPTWTGAKDTGNAAFWMRRAALETAVHLWDAAAAVGQDHDISADLALDGFDELAELFPALQEWSGHVPDATLTVAPEDCDRRWVYRGGSDIGQPIALTGGAAEIYLQLWGRRRPPAVAAPAVGEWLELIETMAA
jgi:uncharacterized protein (TIGR03083 family)